MPAMPLAPDLEHDPRSLPPIFNPSATRTGIGPHNSKAECFTASELSLSRALNSLLPPSLKAAEIRSFKSKPELGQDLRTGTCTGNGDNKLPTLAGDNPKNGNGTGLGGSMTSLQLFNATHLPPRETIRRLATRLTTCLGITFFIVESSAEVESLVDRVYSYCDHYHAARQKPGSDDASSGDFHAVGKGSDSAWTKTTIASERSPQPPTTTEICEILAMAAVGSQYDQQASASLRQACFHSARFGLDDAIEEAEETDAPDDTCYRVLRLLALLAVYQILEKRGSCWRYIGTALNIAKAKGLDQYDLENGSPGEGYLASQHMGMRKIWGTLICLESWIAATLGKPLTTQINLAERIKIGDPIFCCREDSSYPGLDSDEGSLATRSLQTALVRIAILTAAIQRSLYPSARAGGRATDPIGLVQARMHMADLNQWFETLPANLHLSVLLREDAPPLATSAKGRAIAFAERSSMLLGHCLYLSAIMLLTRRIFLSVVNDPDGGYEILHRKGDTTNLPSEKKEALDFVSSCIMAANVMGRIMGLMVSEERLVSKCWMAIYPSFNASLLLLFHLTQRKLLRGDSVVDARFAPGSGHIRDEDDTEAVETTENAKKCLSALEFCAAGGDELSKWYLQVLAPFRKVLGGVSEREIRKRVESIKGDMGQPGFNSVMEEEVTAYPLLPPTGAYNPHDNAMLPSQPGRPPTLITLTAASPPSKTHNRRSTPAYPDNTKTPANQSATTNASDDPAVLSSHIYNILTVSAQCAFRPEDVSKVVIAGTEYSGSVGHSVPHPSPAPPLGNVRSSHRGSSASSSSDSVSTAASSGTPSSSSRSASSSVEAPSSTLHPNTAYAHSRTRLGRACAQEHEGARITKRASEQQLQSTQPGGAHVYGVGGVKRMKMEAYTALGFGADGKTPSQADLIALLKRAV